MEIGIDRYKIDHRSNVSNHYIDLNLTRKATQNILHTLLIPYSNFVTDSCQSGIIKGRTPEYLP